MQAALERFAKERVGMERFVSFEWRGRSLRLIRAHSTLRSAPRITLNATVVSIEPIGKLSDFPSPKWTVTYQIAGDPEPKSKICTFLAVCAGLHSDPMPIKLPNQEVFQGLVVHSSELGDPGVYDKVLAADKVAVIGCSKSAADICSYLAGKRGTERPPVTMLSRQNRYFVEIKDKDKVPVLRKAFSWLAPHWRNPEDSYLHGTWLGSNIASTLRNVISKGMAKSIPEPIRPDVSLGVFQDSAIPVASQGLFDRLREGSIVVVHEPNMKLSFSGPKTLSLGEGKSSIDADVVIECTGWKPAFSYFSEDLKARLGLPHKGNPFRLWRGIAPVGVNGIAFNGFIRSLMNSLTSEVAAHWVSSLFQGFIPIPSVQEQNNEIDKIIEWQKQQFPTEHRSDLLGCIYMLHYVAYLEELLKDMGCRTNRSNSWFDAIAPYVSLI